MQEKQTPGKKETTNDLHSHPLLDVEEESKRRREEAIETGDDREELSFDLPRD